MASLSGRDYIELLLIHVLLRKPEGTHIHYIAWESQQGDSVKLYWGKISVPLKAPTQPSKLQQKLGYVPTTPQRAIGEAVVAVYAALYRGIRPHRPYGRLVQQTPKGGLVPRLPHKTKSNLIQLSL